MDAFTRMVIASIASLALCLSSGAAETAAAKTRDLEKAKAFLRLTSTQCRECAPMPKTAAAAKTRDMEKAKTFLKTMSCVPKEPSYLYIRQDGWHTHQCPNCGTEWSHPDSSVGDKTEHKCPNPNCSGQSWTPKYRNTKLVPDVPSNADEDEDDNESVVFLEEEEAADFPTAQKCPNGRCPPPQALRSAFPGTVIVMRNQPGFVVPARMPQAYPRPMPGPPVTVRVTNAFMGVSSPRGFFAAVADAVRHPFRGLFHRRR